MQVDARLESSGRRLNFKNQLRCCFCKCELRDNLPLFLCARGKRAPNCDAHYLGFDWDKHSRDGTCRPENVGGAAGGAGGASVGVACRQ